MNNNEENRRPEEIEHDIQRTRAEVSSTLDAIGNKLTPSQMKEQAVAYAREQAYSYARNSKPVAYGTSMANTVRDNPVPAIMMGIGLAWLMAARKRSDRTRWQRQWSDYDNTYDNAYDGSAGMGATSGMVGDTSREGKMRRAASKVSETGRDLKNRMSEASHRLTGKASEFGQQLSGQTYSMGSRAREMTQGARERMDELSHRSQREYYRAKDSVSQMMDDQPLAVAAIGLVIGAILGAALPRTQREDEMLGQTRDELVGRAKETVREQAENVKESAQRIVQEAEKKVDEGTSTATRTQGNGSAATQAPPV